MRRGPFLIALVLGKLSDQRNGKEWQCSLIIEFGSSTHKIKTSPHRPNYQTVALLQQKALPA